MTAPARKRKRPMIMIMFEHPTCDVDVDIHIPLPEPIEEGIDAMAARVRPACPICKEPMHYSAWGFSDTDDEDDETGARHVRRPIAQRNERSVMRESLRDTVWAAAYVRVLSATFASNDIVHTAEMLATPTDSRRTMAMDAADRTVADMEAELRARAKEHRAMVLGLCPFCNANLSGNDPFVRGAVQGLIGKNLTTFVENQKTLLTAQGIDPETMHRFDCKRPKDEG